MATPPVINSASPNNGAPPHHKANNPNSCAFQRNQNLNDSIHELHKKVRDISFEQENEILLDQLDKMENEVFLKNVSNSAQLKRLYRFKRKVGLNLKVLNLSSDWVSSFEKLPLDSVEIKDLKDSYKDAISDFDHLHLQGLYYGRHLCTFHVNLASSFRIFLRSLR